VNGELLRTPSSSSSKEERRVEMSSNRQVKNTCNQQVSAETRMHTGGGIEENALRDAIYRSSRGGWTNTTDRPRQQPQQPTLNTV